MARQSLPGWSWEEDYDAGQRQRLACRVVSELDSRLAAFPGHRIYAVTGNPGLSRHFEAALKVVVGAERHLVKVARQGRADAYVTSAPVLFARVLPILFEFGPPEVSVLAITEAAAEHEGLEGVITKAVKQADGGGEGVVCMNFASGDLIRTI